jgi:hypothetical protein
LEEETEEALARVRILLLQVDLPLVLLDDVLPVKDALVVQQVGH